MHRVCIDCEDFGVCKECGLKKPASEFTPGELTKSQKAGRRGRCRACVQCCNEGRTCSQCGEKRPREHYTSDKAWQRASRICTICKSVKECSKCGVSKPRDEYTSDFDWRFNGRRCKTCKATLSTQPMVQKAMQCVWIGKVRGSFLSRRLGAQQATMYSLQTCNEISVLALPAYSQEQMAMDEVGCPCTHFGNC